MEYVREILMRVKAAVCDKLTNEGCKVESNLKWLLCSTLIPYVVVNVMIYVLVRLLLKRLTKGTPAGAEVDLAEAHDVGLKSSIPQIQSEEEEEEEEESPANITRRTRKRNCKMMESVTSTSFNFPVRSKKVSTTPPKKTRLAGTGDSPQELRKLKDVPVVSPTLPRANDRYELRAAPTARKRRI